MTEKIDLSKLALQDLSGATCVQATEYKIQIIRRINSERVVVKVAKK